MTRSRSPLPALIAQWARIVDFVEQQARLFEDYRADISVRHEIACRLRERVLSSETREMLLDLDQQFRAATVAADECIHGADLAVREGWTPDREWYFWRAQAARPDAMFLP